MCRNVKYLGTCCWMCLEGFFVHQKIVKLLKADLVEVYAHQLQNGKSGLQGKEESIRTVRVYLISVDCKGSRFEAVFGWFRE